MNENREACPIHGDRDETRHVRIEDGYPHESHRWRVADSALEITTAPPPGKDHHSICAECGVDIEEDEALEPCIDGDRDESGEWLREDAVTCVSCPDCAFTFDAGHTDVDGGGYSCPACESLALRTALQEADEALEELARDWKHRGKMLADSDRARADIYRVCAQELRRALHHNEENLDE